MNNKPALAPEVENELYGSPDAILGVLFLVRETLTELIASVGADPSKTRDTARRLDLSNNYVWPVSRFINAEDILTAGSEVMDRVKFEKICDACEAKGAPEPAAEEPAPAAEEDTVLEPPPVEDGAADDILAEFTKTLTDSIPELNKKAKPAPKAKFVEEKEPEPGASGESTDAEGGPVDTERMLAEMADLEAAAASGGGGGDLEDEVDTEKMAAEAAKLISGE